MRTRGFPGRYRSRKGARKRAPTSVAPPSAKGTRIYVVKAYKAGIVEGYPDGTFGYDRPVTREEAAAMIQRGLGLAEARESFADVPDGARFAGAIGAVSAAGIMKGYNEREFRPGATMTRGEAAAAAALRSYEYCRTRGCRGGGDR